LVHRVFVLLALAPFVFVHLDDLQVSVRIDSCSMNIVGELEKPGIGRSALVGESVSVFPSDVLVPLLPLARFLLGVLTLEQGE
jgi:hypothetical protein